MGHSRARQEVTIPAHVEGRKRHSARPWPTSSPSHWHGASRPPTIGTERKVGVPPADPRPAGATGQPGPAARSDRPVREVTVPRRRGVGSRQPQQWRPAGQRGLSPALAASRTQAPARICGARASGCVLCDFLGASLPGRPTSQHFVPMVLGSRPCATLVAHGRVIF